ncbi:hypothetical protein RBU61_00750 [Tissierella sp. MB52-C2]|uniref:hypothetical protein n=1 Tax=Tissierella sp. MB52-C2 TaxID=3070999 RepID=UPI00280AF714|nr:hypothetical protein [Tissierella sp. MB52-C2]WMM25220.1 hypothetical protein RBU61_00750 [Tissierella sp. MB52-C2]
MKINKGAKVGIMIEIIVLVIMIFLALFNKTIPSVLSWIFVVGLVIALSGTLVTLSKRNDKDESAIYSYFRGE